MPDIGFWYPKGCRFLLSFVITMILRFTNLFYDFGDNGHICFCVGKMAMVVFVTSVQFLNLSICEWRYYSVNTCLQYLMIVFVVSSWYVYIIYLHFFLFPFSSSLTPFPPSLDPLPIRGLQIEITTGPNILHKWVRKARWGHPWLRDSLFLALVDCCQGKT